MRVRVGLRTQNLTITDGAFFIHSFNLIFVFLFLLLLFFFFLFSFFLIIVNYNVVQLRMLGAGRVLTIPSKSRSTHAFLLFLISFLVLSPAV